MPGSGSAHLLTPFEALSSVRFSFRMYRSSLSALAGESIRMNVDLDRGIKTSSTGRERIGESVTEMKDGVGELLSSGISISNPC
ncbi:hypothetical protein Hanom_Chr12g01123871 [Helianthus anomalus]